MISATDNRVCLEHIRLFDSPVQPLGPSWPLRAAARRVRPRREDESTQACLDQGAGDEFLQWLLRRAELDPGQYRPEPLRRRLGACLRAVGAKDIGQARARVVREPGALTAALHAVLLGVTSFFRDGPVFDLLSQRVLPELLQRRGRVNVWSAACSSGAELYSVAMLLAESGHLEGSRLLGTDRRGNAIARAQAGEFSLLEIAGLSPHRRGRFLEPAESGYRIVPEVRLRLEWQRADVLAEPAPGGPWDLILCRNLAIYLQPAASEAMWSKLAAALAPGGVLVVGKGERPPRELFAHRLHACVFRKP